jgi:hypothetical protein
MRFGKNESINSRWKLLILFEEEIDRAMEELLQFNIKMADRAMGECTKREIPLEFAKLIVDKQLMSSFTYLSFKVDEVAKKLNERDKPDYNKYQKTAEGNFGKEVVLGKSDIAKTFEKVEESG